MSSYIISIRPTLAFIFLIKAIDISTPSHFASWLQAARLRTLPLAIANIAMGNGLAAINGVFNWAIAILTIATAVSLQILSNYSNDYGDDIHGADHLKREGPSRAVQSGILSSSQMKKAMIIWSIISFLLGSALILLALASWPIRILFWILGNGAIWAAINYTAGDNPYGYRGKGDISVFIFFGIVAVSGCYYLQTGEITYDLILPAITCGALSVAVLNVNNIRDIESDRLAGKESIPVKIGKPAALKYHAILLIGSIVSLTGYSILNYYSPIQFLFLLTIPQLTLHFFKVQKAKSAMDIDPMLKQLALATALIVALFLIGHLL